MRRNKHLLLWSSVAALALLAAAAIEENFLKEWRRIQRSARADAGPIELHLRQIVIPALGATDRCVSCHVGMAPGEKPGDGARILAAHKPVVHDPAEFGCTVCHGGQGRATERNDAHGQVRFWPAPMIPMRFVHAGCGSCHAHLRVPDIKLLREGANLVERHDCLACHRIDGRGGTLRPGGAGGMEGPDLSRAGASGYDGEWYRKHLDAWKQGAAGPWAASFGPIDEAERRAIDTFLGSRVGAPGLVEAKALFHSLGCRGCHRVGGVGGDDGPDLTGVGEKDPGRLDFRMIPGEPTLANWLAEHSRSPATVVPDSQMPILGLTEEEIEGLLFYMLSLRRTDFPEAYWPKDRIRVERFGEREFSGDGATVFGAFCAACHGRAGQGMRYGGMAPFPAIANPDFLAVASDAFLEETIRRGRPGRRMPAWGEKEGGLRLAEIAEVIAHLRRLGSVAAAEPDVRPPRWVRGDVAAGASLFEAHCAGCHGARGEGAEGPALDNQVLLSAATDTYLVETIGRGRRGTSMPGFRKGSPVHSTLSESEIESVAAAIRRWEVVR